MVSFQVNKVKSQPQNENNHFRCYIYEAENAEAGTRLCWLLSQEDVNEHNPNMQRKRNDMRAVIYLLATHTHTLFAMLHNLHLFNARHIGPAVAAVNVIRYDLTGNFKLCV